MRVIGKKFGRNPEIMEISEELESLQEFVGGYIETPFVSYDFRDMNIVMVVNEEATFLNLQPTLAFVKDDMVLGCIYGQYFFCGIKHGEMISLNEEQIQFIMDNLVFNGANNNDGLEVDILYI